MEPPQHLPSTRTGTPGLDVFKIAGRSISGFFPSFKTDDQHQVRMPYTTTLELRLALYLEYHPQVRSYQRGDLSPVAARAYHICTPLGTPYCISYLYEGKLHDYLPDFVGTLCDGGLLIAEAGRAEEKRQGKALAKAEAAGRLAQLKGGAYWIGTEEQLNAHRSHNLLYLHARRQPFPTYEEIATTLLAHWRWGDLCCVNELVQRFGSRWSEAEVEATVWKLVGDAASHGRLLVDLTEVVLGRTTPLALLDPSLLPILPDPLPARLEGARQEPALLLTDAEGEADLSSHPPGRLPGPTFDASVLTTKEEQEHFHRNVAAVTAVLAGGKQRAVAREYQMHPYSLARLVRRVQAFGQMACVPHRTYHRERALRPEFQQLIRQLYTHPLRPTIMAVYEDVRLKQRASELSTREGKEIQPPTYWQVYYYLKSIAQEAAVAQARSGMKQPPHERMSPQSFILSIPYPAHLCQVDEHTLDQLVVTPEGTLITGRVHGAALICVKTAAILGAVLSLDPLREEDYMRLIKQALEPKERLTALYECKHRWPCFGKPAAIFHDRGNIFTSERATQVLVDRLGIVTERAPASAPSAKGTVEALFAWTTRKLEHRLPGTTKATLEHRGTYDSGREVARAGITLDVLEQFFIQAIVDGYMQEWDPTRRKPRIALWESAVQATGVPRWLGSQDDLKLLLMKAANRKNPATGHYAITHGTLSFLGRRYVSPGLLDRLRGKEIDIYYDRRDLSVIYLFLHGELVGEAYCPEFMGRRVSSWEAQAERQAETAQAKEAAAESRANRQRIQQTALQGRRVLALERKRLERRRLLDQQRQEIHPARVQAVLEGLTQHAKSGAPEAGAPRSLLPPAEPEDDPVGTPVNHLPVRPRGEPDA